MEFRTSNNIDNTSIPIYPLDRLLQPRYLFHISAYEISFRMSPPYRGSHSPSHGTAISTSILIPNSFHLPTVFASVTFLYSLPLTSYFVLWPISATITVVAQLLGKCDDCTIEEFLDWKWGWEVGCTGVVALVIGIAFAKISFAVMQWAIDL